MIEHHYSIADLFVSKKNALGKLMLREVADKAAIYLQGMGKLPYDLEGEQLVTTALQNRFCLEEIQTLHRLLKPDFTPFPPHRTWEKLIHHITRPSHTPPLFLTTNGH